MTKYVTTECLHGTGAANRPYRLHERGQSLPLIVLFLWLLAASALLLGALVQRTADRARAQAAADAVALGVAIDPSAQDFLGEGNNSTIVHIDRNGSGAQVTVEVGTAAASARAEAARAEWQSLHPRVVVALQKAEIALNERIPIVSGFRSYAEQKALWDARASNPYPVAPPGTSRHETGMAVDVPLRLAARLAAVQEQTGLCQVLPVLDPIHFEPCRMTPTP